MVADSGDQLVPWQDTLAPRTRTVWEVTVTRGRAPKPEDIPRFMKALLDQYMEESERNPFMTDINAAMSTYPGMLSASIHVDFLLTIAGECCTGRLPKDILGYRNRMIEYENNLGDLPPGPTPEHTEICLLLFEVYSRLRVGLRRIIHQAANTCSIARRWEHLAQLY